MRGFPLSVAIAIQLSLSFRRSAASEIPRPPDLGMTGEGEASLATWSRRSSAGSRHQNPSGNQEIRTATAGSVGDARDPSALRTSG